MTSNFEIAQECIKIKKKIQNKRTQLKTISENSTEFNQLETELKVLNDHYRQNC